MALDALMPISPALAVELLSALEESWRQSEGAYRAIRKQLIAIAEQGRADTEPPA